MTEIDPINLAAAISSRICHDLVSPLGAVSNGLELMESEKDDTVREQALTMIGKSAGDALVKLQFFRLAFGKAGAVGPDISLNEVSRHCAGLLSSADCSVKAAPDLDSVPKWAARMILNLILICEPVLSRGGALKMEANAENGLSVRLTAKGNGVKPDEGNLSIMREGPPEGDIPPRQVPAILLYLIGEEKSVDYEIDADEQDSRLEIEARVPAQSLQAEA